MTTHTAPRTTRLRCRPPLLLALLLLLLLSSTTPATAHPPRYTWPLPPPRVVLRTFQAPTTPYGPGHRGVDLAAPPGTPVLAPADATVVFAGRVGERWLVSLSHGGGVRTTYEPVTPTVERGLRVQKGTPIATVAEGHAGCRTTCLHWGAHRTARGTSREYLDPLKLLATGRTRLFPANQRR